MYTLRLLGGASLEGPDGPVAGRAGLRQRMALLAILAIEHPRPLSRDKLVAYLWPESGSDDARHLLRESLYILRSALGDDSVLSTGGDLRLNPERLTCDVWEFDAAIARDDCPTAVGLYHGPFLSGFHLGDAEEFEPWSEGERSRLARKYWQAMERLAERAMQGGDPVRAAEWWSRLAAEDRYNSRLALRYMQALDAAGDRAGALRHAQAHTALLRVDLDAAPEREIVALAERLRLESRAATPEVSEPEAPSAAPAPASAESFPTPSAAEARRQTRRGWLTPALLVLAAVVALGVVGGSLSRARPVGLELAPERVAAAPFENRTGRADLDDLGAMAADWIVRGVMETPLFDLPDLEAVYARGKDETGRPADPLETARANGAGIVVRGSYYVSGDSVLFQAAIVDVAGGRVLRSFDPVGAPLERAITALEVLRERIASGLGQLVDSLGFAGPLGPDAVSTPNLSAYRELVAGLKEDDWKAQAQHYRRAARLDTTFAAPLLQLGWAAILHDECSITDSIGVVLDRRRDQLSRWNRITADVLRARCRDDRAKEVALLEQRYRAYPQSSLARGTYAGWGLQGSNQPRTARAILGGRAPRSEPEWQAWYWWWMAGSHHILGGYRTELDITDRWRDTAAWEWRVVRGRALAALGREAEALKLAEGMAGASVRSVAESQLQIATELAVHGHPRTGRAIAEHVLTRLEHGSDTQWGRAAEVAQANRLLGRKDAERHALEQIVRSDADTLVKLQVAARLAVLLGDSAGAERVDRTLAERSDRPLRNPEARGAEIVARAQMAAGFGRRERAIALLHDAGARGRFPLGYSHAFHQDLLLAPLRGYPPFEALLEPDD